MATKSKKVNGNKVREEWLQRAVSIFIARWSRHGVTVPFDVQVTCGFPGGGNAAKRIGECWPRARSASKVNEVMINPTQSDTTVVLDVLGHELLHAVDDCKNKHGRPFTALSKLVGYSGGKGSSAETPEARALLAEIAAKLGKYPHAEVFIVKKQQKESSGLHKFICAAAGEEEGEDAPQPDVLYSTAKMVDVHGIPVCRCHGEQMVPVERKDKKVVTTV